MRAKKERLSCLGTGERVKACVIRVLSRGEQRSALVKIHSQHVPRTEAWIGTWQSRVVTAPNLHGWLDEQPVFHRQ